MMREFPTARFRFWLSVIRISAIVTIIALTLLHSTVVESQDATKTAPMHINLSLKTSG